MTGIADQLVSISEAARRTGVAASALRYYDERGVAPATSRRGGRRVYDRAALRRIVFLRFLQWFDTDLETIDALLNGRGPSWPEAAEERITELARKEERAGTARRLLEHARECPSARPWEDCPYLLRALDDQLEAEGEIAMPQSPSDDELAGMRRSYDMGELTESEAADDPLDQFLRWLQDARECEVAEPNAMVLATVDPDGLPSARTVLLKQADERGFVFYTNLESDKAAALREHPVASLLFGWYAIERQVRIRGTVTELARPEVADYFTGRPRESQLGAWASRQSSVVADRAALDRAYAEVQRRFPEESEIPPPEFWGGYRVSPTAYEFWQGRQGRLHDRIRYRRGDGAWVKERLAP